ncbi:DUF3147 family protein [Thalassotalea aquiviva]|uniref:DUF3147 family protein n=1 Tax=Thalassotalea aquiviva TaxID=3242415 RepID=UPI00352B6130
MNWIITKYLITAGIVVLVSEVAKRSDKFGALIVALPLVTILALIWMYIDGQSSEKLANHAYYTFWYVVPTLPMFLAFPWLLERFSFWATLGLSAILSIVCFFTFAALVKLFGINLL